MADALKISHKNETPNPYAGKTVVIIVLIYTIVNAIRVYFSSDGEMWMWRLGIGLTSALLVFVMNKIPGLSSRVLSILIPSILMTGQIAATLTSTHDSVFFLVFAVCTAVSMLYINYVGMLIYIAIANVAVIIMVFIIRYPVLGLSEPIEYITQHYVVYNLTNLLLFSVCVFSQNQYWRSKRRAALFDTIMDVTPSFMLITDDEARVEYISESLAKWINLSDRNSVKNTPLMSLFPSSGLEELFADIDKSDKHIDKIFELNLEGKKRTFIIRSSPFRKDGAGRFFEWYEITDITEATIRTEEATRAKSDFLASMSHEIRTPMNAIVGMTSLLRMTALDEIQKNQTKAIKEASVSLLRIINNILDFSKIGAGMLETVNMPFKFESFIQDITAAANPYDPEGRIAFTTSISKDIPQIIICDELRLKQVVSNLLNNAFQFTHRGLISLRSWHETTDSDEIKLFFSVSDTGIGIEAENIDKLFIEFERVSTRKKRELSGTGLGLAISKRLVELMGGSISCTSTAGVGTVFTFFIMARRDWGSQPLVPAFSANDLHLLCYEPNQYYLDSFKEIIDDLGLNEVTVSTGDFETFEAELSEGEYSHIFYCEAAIRIMEHFGGNGAQFLLKRLSNSERIERSPNIIQKPFIISQIFSALKEKRRTAIISHFPAQKLFTSPETVILLVDDSMINRVVGEGLIQSFGPKVISARDGSEAIDRIKNVDVDMVFMDHIMYGIDGVETTRLIRELGGVYASIPIVMLTANAVFEQKTLYAAAGANDFIEKPLDINELERVLRAFLPPEKIFDLRVED